MATRYITYGCQFLLSLVIADRLGPFYMGVYGLVNLIISYFAQINFGIPHSLNVLLVHNKDDENRFNAYYINSVFVYLILSIFILLCYGFICLLDLHIGKGEYDIKVYLPLIIGISIITYINSVFTTAARVKNDLNLLSIVGSIPIILNIFIIWFFKEDHLVMALTLSQFVSTVIITFICYKRNVFPKWNISDLGWSYIKVLLQKGALLFLYNSCFYFIIISIKSIISANYTVEEFGFFTFSYTLANAFMLLINSFNVAIFPKTIDMLSSDDKDVLRCSLAKMRVGYTTFSHLLIYAAIIIFPLFVLILPKYEDALNSMYLISLTVLMNTTSFGYSTITIAKNKESIAAKISLFSFLINVALGILLVYVFKVEYYLVILASMIAYMFNAFLFALEGEKIIYGHYNIKETIKNFFPLRLFIPYTLALVLSIIGNVYLMWIPLVTFLLLNFKDLDFIKKIINRLTKDPNVIDI